MKREKLNTFIIDHLSMVCYISDMETYEMLFLSDPGLRMFGLQSEKDYLGRKCYEILQEETRLVLTARTRNSCEGKNIAGNISTKRLNAAPRSRTAS